MRNKARVIKGYGVASGQNGDIRFPGGTILMQKGHFKALGLDLDRFFMGTLNIDIAPLKYIIRKPKYFFPKVNWTDHLNPENFFFFDLVLYYHGNKYAGYIYMPDPSTKQEHIQGSTSLELILPEVGGIAQGAEVEIEVNPGQIQIH